MGDKAYTLYCTQLEEVVFEYAEWNKVKQHAYAIIKDRSESVNDDLAKEFKGVLEQGYDRITAEYILETLYYWGYKVFRYDVLN